jgi:RHS repeat-associated protein
MQRFHRTLRGRLLALGLAVLLGPLACVPPEILEPRSGLRDYQTPGVIPVPGGFVDAAGGNLVLTRQDISIDTPLGRQVLGATYNATDGVWRWSHQMTYDGSIFVDPSGAVFDLSEVADGDPIEGSIWERVDSETIRTKGGLAHHFGPDGVLDHLRWATLEYPRITFSASEVAQCTAAAVCAPLFTLSSDATGRLEAIVDARTGRTARFDYDASGRLVGARSPGDVESGRAGVVYEYEALGTLLVARVGSEGDRVEYAYGPGRRIAAVTRIGEGDPRHAFHYVGKTSAGHYPTIHAGPLGGWTRYAFDARRRLLRVERLGASEAVVITWSGLRPSRKSGPGGVAHFGFASDRLVSYTAPSGNVVTLSYEPGGLDLADPTRPPLRRREDLLGLVEERSYDGQGRVVSVVDGAGETSARTHVGASVSSITRLGVTLGFPVFGVHGHWLEAELGGETVARRAFDPVGNVVVPRSARRAGGVLGLGYDADRRRVSYLLASSDDAGRVTGSEVVDIERRSDGRVRRISRAGGADHEIDYDALGRAIRIRERVDGTWQTTSIEYDAADHQTARQRDNGMREEYEYDAFGRMTRHRALRHGLLEGEAEFTWLQGRLVAYRDSIRSLTELYTYDDAGRLVGTIFGFGEAISREYDLRGRVVREVFTAPGVGAVADVGYEYDAADRMIRLVDRAAGDVLIEDVVSGGLRRSTLSANGLDRTYTYDAQARLVAMETRDAGGQVVESTAVTRATALGPPRLQVSSTTVTPLAATQEHYWLPAGSSLAHPDSLAGKRLFAWRDGAGGEAAFAWSALSDPQDTAAGDAFVYNAEGNRMLAATLAPIGSTIDYAYDEAGFVTRRDGVALSWTAAGRLASFGADTLVWDMAGRLVEATLGGESREFRLFGGRVQSTLTSVGALDLGAVSIHLGTGERRYRHTDFRGNVSFVTDDLGEVVAHHRYTPYGIDASWGSEPDGVAFERRSRVGPLVLMGARVLDSQVGRFLSPDPHLQPVNQYAYTLGNPIDFEDRDGREMTPRQALEVGMDIVTVATGFFFVAAVTLGAGPIAVTAAGTAYVVTHAVVTAALLIDASLGGEAPARRVVSPSTPPEPPSPPAPPGPGEGGSRPSPPAVGTEILVLEAAPVPACTPLAATSPIGRSRSGGILLLLTNLAFGVAWWRSRRREGT